MPESHIFLTHTQVDQEVFCRYLTAGFLRDGSPNVDRGLLEISTADRELEYIKALSGGRVQLCLFDDKEDFREKSAGLRQMRSESSMVFFGSLENYSIPLQEGMLRLLEEPPSNCQLVLTARSVSRVLPTILSRCQVHTLPLDLVYKMLDGRLSDLVQRKLPTVSQFVKEYVQYALGRGEFPDLPDVTKAKIEREEIDFWLWQLGAYLQAIYTQNPVLPMAGLITAVLQAQKLNQDNVQRKLVLRWLEVGL